MRKLILAAVSGTAFALAGCEERETITPRSQTEPEPVETGEGTFLVAPDGTVLERLSTDNDEESRS